MYRITIIITNYIESLRFNEYLISDIDSDSDFEIKGLYPTIFDSQVASTHDVQRSVSL